MDQEHSPGTASLTLVDQTTVETHVVGQPHPNAKYGGLAIYGDSPGPNPFLNLASRGKASPREHLLKTFAFLTPAMLPAAIISRCPAVAGSVRAPAPCGTPAGTVSTAGWRTGVVAPSPAPTGRVGITTGFTAHALVVYGARSGYEFT